MAGENGICEGISICLCVSLAYVQAICVCISYMCICMCVYTRVFANIYTHIPVPHFPMTAFLLFSWCIHVINLQYPNKQKFRIQNDATTIWYVAIQLFFKHLLNSYHIPGIILKTDTQSRYLPLSHSEPFKCIRSTNNYKPAYEFNQNVNEGNKT